MKTLLAYINVLFNMHDYAIPLVTFQRNFACVILPIYNVTITFKPSSSLLVHTANLCDQLEHIVNSVWGNLWPSSCEIPVCIDSNKIIGYSPENSANNNKCDSINLVLLKSPLLIILTYGNNFIKLCGCMVLLEHFRAFNTTQWCHGSHNDVK